MATPTRKRKLEYLDVSDIGGPTEAATVSGIITELSPVKVSRKNSQVKYFSGKVTDGKKTVRVVSFDPSLRNQMEKSRMEGSAVSIVNCQIKQSTQVGSSDYEILASTRSTVEASPTKKFQLPPDLTLLDPDTPVEVELKDLRDLRVNQRVTVTVKVVEVMEPTAVTTKTDKKLMKQDCKVADAGSYARIVLWQQDIGKLQPDSSYKIINITIRSFNDIKYLSLSEDAVINQVSDIGVVADVSSMDEYSAGANQVLEADLVGVWSTEDYRACISCKAKVTNVTDHVGECSKCEMKMKLSMCPVKKTAKVVIRPDTGKDHTIMLFTEQLESLIKNTDGATVSDKLLAIDRIKVTINTNNVAISAKPV